MSSCFATAVALPTAKDVLRAQECRRGVTSTTARQNFPIVTVSTRKRSSRGNLSVRATLARDKPAQDAQAAPIGPAPGKTDWGNQPRKGCEILVEALEREGVQTVFAYPGGASMEIHQALTKSKQIRNILCRHEQGEVFAAEGYAKVSGEVGVCIATSGPGATNLVTGLADALLDSVPLVAITGQVPRRMIGTDAFQETPIVEVTRQITKHNFLVMNLEDLPRIVKEAFFLARTGRPGPVLIDVPKDIQQQMGIPNWDDPMQITGYINRLPKAPASIEVQRIYQAIKESKKPILYVGGGTVECSEDLTEFARRCGIPVASTLMGLGNFPSSDPLFLGMLGMHGTVAANYAVDQADLLLAFGVRFDDRVTGKLETFASHARIVHVDIDPAEINKNKDSHITLCADVKPVLQTLNNMVSDDPLPETSFTGWLSELESQKQQFPMKYPQREDVILPQWAIEVVREETKGEAIITTGVGQHQMWAAQWYGYDMPRHWVTSGGLGSMGFGLPSALGAAAAFDGYDGRGKKVVVDFDGDGSFMMNPQELATVFVHKLPVKMVVLNNQHLGMVVQWEDRFYKHNRAHTYLGKEEAEWHVTMNEKDIYPDLPMMARSCGVEARRVIKKEDLRAAVREMLEYDGPFLLDVMVPHIEHVLPMIPGGGSFKDIITDGDGAQEY
uniref:Acetolactate synthase n=1 Tax=Tetraselmis sp. GSL018 TaxID=582737 RepID=A0A061S889_9CHLO|mmetsp:Transcript_24539/g.58329  ORF Transcript_24539/g.58329 Transcript_24539/m.58329 type:complete len:672 (-) Transcript_24539:115-2130(-)|eukprot:CAMPEP_0177599788 /NCGR_PEP_ID=MMETSP0419_2-20121207/13206_1 /TAXON_ID=582737 /ORGANISM="Tetraselmis sp., Strain GSL018" /LENGTH=671 /DNA_ID=CAMNT_0019092597 /DNA_START=57 /DNA_END=2072 /DNA_ORIENTATION=-